MSSGRAGGDVLLSASNVGGIDETRVALPADVTVLEGRNATNRTSLLRAVMAALGSENATLKGDAPEGSVELSLGEETYTRTLERVDGTVVTGGDPYLDDPELADLFAFLLESNEARRAVARGDDLRQLIMEPVDTAAINREIEQLEAEKDRLDEELEELDALKRELPTLERERNRIESEIEDKRAALEDKEAELAVADSDVETKRREKEQLEEKLAALRETRSQLEDVRFEVETEEESLESLRRERADLESERGEIADDLTGEIEEVESRIAQLRSRKRTLDSEMNELQSTIQFNEETLGGTDENPLAGLTDGSDASGSVTDQLLADDEAVTCWTCGSDVERQQIASTLDRLRELRQEKLDEVRGLEERIADLADKKERLADRQRRREEVERRLDEIDEEMAERRRNLEELRDRREALIDDVEELEAEIDSLEEQEYETVLDLHREANELEFELERLESDLDGVKDEIASVEEQLAERDEIEDRREAIQEELADLRTRIDRIEQQAVEQFNDHMETVLDILDYENLERIWIERTEREVREGRQTVSKTLFDLHVVRRSSSGTTYEDTVDHLSESEREVTGLIFALAGYLVHDVYETLPFILLDSLEAIDSERIATLVDYLEEYADYLIVALLPEDAAALDAEYHRVTEI